MGFQLEDGYRRPGVSPDRQVDAQVTQAAWAGPNLAGGELQAPWVLGAVCRLGRVGPPSTQSMSINP